MMKHLFRFCFILLGSCYLIIPAYAVDPYIVPPLPLNNLIQNPWFTVGNEPSFSGWTDGTPGGAWTLSPKVGNPTPDGINNNSARISTGRGDDEAGKSVNPGVDTYLYQIIQSDPTKTGLVFDMYWVTHTLNPGEVNIYGGDAPNGPWTFVWKPFYQVYTKQIIPGSGRGQDLWEYYSNLTNQVSTTISQGYPFYKVEVHANLPDESGGFKITGIYFATTDGSGVITNTQPTMAPTTQTNPTEPAITSAPNNIVNASQNQNNILYFILFLIIILLLLLIIKKYFFCPSPSKEAEMKEKSTEIDTSLHNSEKK